MKKWTQTPSRNEKAVGTSRETKYSNNLAPIWDKIGGLKHPTSSLQKVKFMIRLRVISLAVLVLLAVGQGNTSWSNFVLELDSDQFGISNVFSDVDVFRFLVGVDEPLTTGVYDNPALNFVVLRVTGDLSPGTPSGFPSFGLTRDIGGSEFYDQGSSFRFEIAADADLSDGVTLDELVGTSSFFEINAREVNTGRYHPPLLQLNSNGTGRIQNSNNMGGVNPATGRVVDVDFGDEYITDLSFSPANTLLIPAGADSLGDFNGDGNWDCADVDMLVQALNSPNPDPMFDISLNGAVTPFDLFGANVGWLAAAGRNNPDLTGGNPFLPGDGNLDGVVDASDFNIWNENKFTSAPAWCSGDHNADGQVDASDFNIWNENKFTSSGDTTSVVPEPAGFGLLLIAGLGCFLTTRRKIVG